jgi:SAM-dependent methyltransferase
MTSRPPSTQEKYPEFHEDQRQFFDELITRDWHTYQNSDWDRTRRFEVDSLFRFVSPTRILDVGCGCGFHDRLMADRTGVNEVVGIDYSEKSIEAAERTYPHPGVRRLVADIRTMSDNDFDLTVSFQVIEHLRDAEEFLRASARQVRSGGWVAVATPNRNRLSNRIRAMLGGQPRLSDPQHYREFVMAELRALGEAVGLKYLGGFGYGMTLGVPRLGWQLIPFWLGLRLGAWLPEWSQCFCAVFQKDETFPVSTARSGQ